MAITIEQQPGDFFPCYNNPGGFVLSSDLEGPSNPIISIGAPSTPEQGIYGLTGSEILLYADFFPPVGNLFPWEGNLITISGTENYDGTYTVLDTFPSRFLLSVGGGGEVETVGTATMNLNPVMETTIVMEDGDENVTLTIPPSNDGKYRVSVSDFIKDYFKFRYYPSSGDGAYFNQYCASIRFSVVFKESYTVKIRTVINGEYVLVDQTISTLLASQTKHCVNAAMNYFDAVLDGSEINSGSFNTKYVIDTSSAPGNTNFLTYRPNVTEMDTDDFIYLSILRGTFSTDDYKLKLEIYGSGGMTSGTLSWDNTPVGYENAHVITWPLTFVNPLIFPPGILYIVAYVEVDGTQRTPSIRINLKDKCEPKYGIIWKNEFGVPECYTFYAPAEQSVANEFTAVGVGDYVGESYQPGNIAKNTATAPKRLTLNTGLINSAHAEWLLGIGRSTEVFIIDYQKQSNMDVIDSAIPVIVQSQTIGTVNSKRNTHNFQIEVEYAYNRSQKGNRVVFDT